MYTSISKAVWTPHVQTGVHTSLLQICPQLMSQLLLILNEFSESAWIFRIWGFVGNLWNTVMAYLCSDRDWLLHMHPFTSIHTNLKCRVHSLPKIGSDLLHAVLLAIPQTWILTPISLWKLSPMSRMPPFPFFNIYFYFFFFCII